MTIILMYKKLMAKKKKKKKVSFYSRYTRDIAAFADKYTEGKVVSVLEGGYSDRALTSAAMGHIVGMRGSLPEGCDEWWTEKELINVSLSARLMMLALTGVMIFFSWKRQRKRREEVNLRLFQQSLLYNPISLEHTLSSPTLKG